MAIRRHALSPWHSIRRRETVSAGFARCWRADGLGPCLVWGGRHAPPAARRIASLRTRRAATVTGGAPTARDRARPVRGKVRGLVDTGGTTRTGTAHDG